MLTEEAVRALLAGVPWRCHRGLRLNWLPAPSPRREQVALPGESMRATSAASEPGQ
jgi:hypothetical protein